MITAKGQSGEQGTAAADPGQRQELLRRALLEVKLARAEAAAAKQALTEPVAVVGMGCRFPGGPGVEGFWQLLADGVCGITEVPPERWDVEEFFDADPDVPGRTYARHGGFVDGIREFDAGVFGISPREAVAMDPQHRLVLEVAWEALEDAGVAPDSLRGSRSGVFVGMRNSDYERMGAADITLIDAYAALGTALNFGANRLSYVLGLEGPSLVVDTACSSSLVTVHLACQALRAGECDLALAGGVNALLAPDAMMALSKGRMLSPSGLCRTFDAAADGYVRGEGCGMVVLKRLSTAVAAGDTILAVIRGSAVNQDGKSSGLTVPRGSAQQDVIRRALAQAGLAPSEVGFVEAHGTGTVLGDPIEVRALARVLGEGRPDGQPVMLGSVKTNIGHLEAAAGIAGVIKACLMVSRGVVPPHLHFTEPNPHVAWNELPVRVVTEREDWDCDHRVVGVSSFGFGGTNSHIIVENPPATAASGAGDSDPADQDGAPALPVVVKVSAVGSGGVREAAARLASWVEAAGEDVDLAGVAWAAGAGRADLVDRAAVVAGSAAELAAGLRIVAAGEVTGGVVAGRRPAGAVPKVAFVAPGHGTRIAGALAGVYGRVPVVTQTLDRLAAVWGEELATPVVTALTTPGAESEAIVADTRVAQPALYGLAVSLGLWWRSVGVTPDLVTGHSVGAYAAAALAGVFSIEDGARLIATRGSLMGALPGGGAMAAVGCPASDLEDLPQVKGGEVVIAVYNSPTDTVVSGPEDAIEAVIAEMKDRGVRASRLKVGCAFHSAQMDTTLAPLEAAFAATSLHAPELDFISDHSGSLAGSEVATPGYWARHTREPVNFTGVWQAIAERGTTTLIELGTGSLLPLAKRTAGQGGGNGKALTCLASVTPGPQAARRLMESAAATWATGTNITWANLTSRPASVPKLPTYAFQRKTYWGAPDPNQDREPVKKRGSGLRPSLVEAATGVIISETELSLRGVPFLDEHRVHGRMVTPGVVLIELMLRAAEHAFEGQVALEDLTLSRPLVLGDDDERTVQVVLDPVVSGRTRARVYSKDGSGGWSLHVEAVVVESEPVIDPDEDLEPEEFQRAASRCREQLDHDEVYQQAWHPSFVLGPSFRLVDSAQRGRSAAVGELNRPAPDSAGVAAGVRPDLLLLDVCVQLILVAANRGLKTWDGRPVHLGTGYERMAIHRAVPDGPIRCTAIINSTGDDSVVGSLLVSDEDGRPIAELGGVTFRPVTPEILDRMLAAAAEGGGHGGRRRRSGVPRPDVMAMRAAGDEDLHRMVLDHLVKLMASVLGSEPGDLDTGVKVTEIADSLMLAELKGDADDDLGVSLPMEALFEEGTLTALAKVLADQIRALGPPPEGAAPAAPAKQAAKAAPAKAEDTKPKAREASRARGSAAVASAQIQRGTKLTPMTVPEMLEHAQLDSSFTVSGAPSGSPDPVLLTGASGFVGAFLLEELLRRREGEVFCMVRAEDADHATRRVLGNLEAYGIDVAGAKERVVPVVADLTKPLLGLSEQAFADLHTRIGSIIHCGAMVKWTYPYSALAPANVAGTREVLRLATVGAPRPVHFISTVGVFSSRDFKTGTVTESELLTNSGPLVVGYAQSKWVSEQMVREAHSKGLPVTIHRINTGSHTTSGAFNRADHLNMLLKGCIEVGMAPENLNMDLQAAPIDFVASAIVELSAQPEMNGRTFHLVNHHPITWPAFYDMVEDFGYPLQRMTFDAWREKVTSRDTGSVALLGLMPFLNDAVDDVSLPVSDSAQTRTALQSTGLDCPPLDTGIVHSLLRRFVTQRFVDPPLALPGRRATD